MNRDGDVKRKRGRPVKEGAKRNRVQFKLTDDEFEMFKYVCESQGKTMTDTFLDGVKMSYNLAKCRKS